MAIRRVTDRLLCAANHQLMQQKAALSAAPSRKRVRDEDDEGEWRSTTRMVTTMALAMAAVMWGSMFYVWGDQTLMEKPARHIMNGQSGTLGV